MKKLMIICVALLASFSITAQTAAFHIEKRGKGTPVLFLPGFATPGSVWNETISHLDGNYQALVVSYAGFNGLPAIKMPWYNTIKEELLAYISKENLTGIYVVGHSMGGNLATDLAAAMPTRIKKVVLVDAIPCMREMMMPGVAASQVQYESPYNKQLLEMKEVPFRATIKMMAGNMTMDTAKTTAIMQWMMAADRQTFVYGYTDLLKLDLREVLPAIKAPVLILAASFPDREVIKKNYEKQYADLANKQFEMAPNSKHFIMFDEPTWLYNNINTFFSK